MTIFTMENVVLMEMMYFEYLDSLMTIYGNIYRYNASYRNLSEGSFFV